MSRTEIICVVLVTLMLLITMWMLIPEDMPGCVAGQR